MVEGWLGGTWVNLIVGKLIEKPNQRLLGMWQYLGRRPACVR